VQLTFLQAAVPLTKKYTKRTDGGYDKTSYPNISKVTSHVEEVTTPEMFAATLRKHGELGNCLHTGSVHTPLKDESRRGAHDKDEKRAWIVLDLDGIEYASVEEFILELPDAFHEVSYVAQHSPSSGLKPGLNMHVFFMLDKAESAIVASDTLRHLNFVTKSLRNKVTLTTSKKILSLPLDWIANKNGRVVYITSPECVGFSDPVAERIEVVKKTYDELRFNFYAVTPEEMKTQNRGLIDELRDAAGLPKIRGELFTMGKNGEILRKRHTDRGRIHDVSPDSETIMRCNIDGGDSDAYFYYTKVPGLIRNHKGEPAIHMEAFDPEYYEKVALPAAKDLWEKDTQPFVFRGLHDDKYYVGLRVGRAVTQQPCVIGSTDKIQDYYAQYGGLGVPDPIPTWRMQFDPRLESQWNPSDKIFNTWRRTELMSSALYRSLPPTVIAKIIGHACGSDAEVYNRFINWVAYIFQNRTKTGTAWIFHGVQGTGKGLLVDHVLRPIFGRDYVKKQQSRNLKAEFNGWMEKAIIVNLDEFDLQDAGNESSSVMQAIKMWITDEFIPIRAMHKESRMTDNYSNFILTTNAKSAMPVDPGDRRISFGVRQEKRLDISPDEVEAIPDELEQFAGYLKGYEVDKQLAHTCLENETKEQAKRLSLTSIELFVEAVKYGKLQYFVDAQDEKSSHDHSLVPDYGQILSRFVSDAKSSTQTLVSVHDLLKAYKLIVKNDKDMTSGKFKKIMEHKNLEAKRMRIGKGRVEGWRVDWEVDAETLQSIGGHIRAVKSQEELEKSLLGEVLASPKEQQ
jgi:hypothetical protein